MFDFIGRRAKTDWPRDNPGHESILAPGGRTGSNMRVLAHRGEWGQKASKYVPTLLWSMMDWVFAVASAMFTGGLALKTERNRRQKEDMCVERKSEKQAQKEKEEIL